MAKTYDTYKDSGIAWIGKIPEKWIVGLVGKYFEEINKPNINQEETNTLQFKMGEIISKSKGDSKYSPETIEAYNVVEPGTIMINGLNLSFDLVSQRIAQVRERGAITSTYLAIFPTKKMKSNYAKYLLKAYDNNKALHAMGRGLRATLSYRTFRSEPVIVPSLDEQQAIASYLDEKCGEINSLISLQEEMISELQAYKQSVITETVTKGLDPNVPMKDSGFEWIGMIPEEWKIQRLRTLGNCQNGISKGGEYFGDEFDFPFVNYTDAYKNIDVPYPEGRANSTEEDRKQYSLIEGDILFTRTSETIDEIGYASTCTQTIPNAVFSGFLIRFRPTGKELYYGFSKYYFRSSIHRAFFVKEMNLVTRASLSQNLLKNLPTLIPPLSEQQAIASYLDEKTSQIDSLIALKQEKITELKDYKKSIIYEYVTGKKKV